MSRTLNVIEIFESINGEGMWQGYPTIFIRLAECNLRCNYCDTTYSYTGGQLMDNDDIVKAVEKFGIKRVTITGGEPGLQASGVYDLCSRLINFIKDMQIEIETNGAVDLLEFYQSQKVSLTMDWKCPGSGMDSNMIFDNLRELAWKDSLKFVVSGESDLNYARELLAHFREVTGYNLECNIIFSPVFGRIQPKEIVEYILKHKMYNCKVQIQSHKIIWPPEMRGV